MDIRFYSYQLLHHYQVARKSGMNRKQIFLLHLSFVVAVFMTVGWLGGVVIE
jgi:hypothetical protein